MTTAPIEKAIIGMAIFAAFPLFFLDKELLGPRRFGWLGAFGAAFTVHFALGPNDETGEILDKFTVAFCSMTMVPHMMQLMKDNMMLGLMSGPPLFIVLYLMVHTAQMDSEEYWRLRAFVHTVVFFLPYLNHLPSETTPNDESLEAELVNANDEVTEQSAASSAASKSKTKTRTNKKKK